jgi:hypothetical protein
MNEEQHMRYRRFKGLLLTFLEDTYHPEKKDVDTIRRFVDKRNIDIVNEVIKEAETILKLDPFPRDWISNTANRLPGDKIYQNYKSATEEDYKRWVRWMIEALEEEARKQGKIK